MDIQQCFILAVVLMLRATLSGAASGRMLMATEAPTTSDVINSILSKGIKIFTFGQKTEIPPPVLQGATDLASFDTPFQPSSGYSTKSSTILFQCRAVGNQIYTASECCDGLVFASWPSCFMLDAQSSPVLCNRGFCEGNAISAELQSCLQRVTLRFKQLNSSLTDCKCDAALQMPALASMPTVQHMLTSGVDRALLRLLSNISLPMSAQRLRCSHSLFHVCASQQHGLMPTVTVQYVVFVNSRQIQHCL